MNFNKTNKPILITLISLMLFALNASAQTYTINEIEIDRKPLNDFSNSIVNKWSKKEIDLNKPFSIEVGISLDEDGKLVREATKFIKSEGDEKLVNAIKPAFQALSDSGYFKFVNNLGIRNFKLTFAQNAEGISGSITSNAASPKEAKAITDAFRVVIAILKANTKDITEKYLIEQATAKNEKSQITLKFKLPSIILRQVLNYELRKALDKKSF